MSLPTDEIPDYGDLMTLEDWDACVACGGFIPYDGSGCWATNNKMDQSSNVWSKTALRPEWATHVVWFNR